MRHYAAVVACAVLAACTTGDVTVPRDQVLYQVSPAPSASSSGGGDFAATIETALAAPDAAAAPRPATPLDADTLNLTLYTIEQQKIDARIAERELAEARSQLVIVQPGAVPQATPGVNIALFAQQTSNAVGQRVYRRSGLLGRAGSCGRFATADEAQRAFLASGGPQNDPMGLDPDGDGFACGWDPTPFRQLRI